MCVLVVALSGLSGAVPAVALSRSGHWLVSHTLGALFHIDGGSDSVDAKTPLVGVSPGTGVANDDKNVYVPDPKTGRVRVFGKSDLREKTAMAVGTHERSVILQVTGGPYLVFPKSGKIVRYGAHYTVIPVGSPVADPMATSDGTLWVRRLDSNRICKVGPTSDSLKCTMNVDPGHDVALVAIDDRPSMIDFSSGKISSLDGSGPDIRIKDMPGSGKVSATSATGGRLPIIAGSKQHPQLLLLDTSTIGTGRAGGGSNSADLPPGDYDVPSTAGDKTVVVNQTTHTITTYDSLGHKKSTQVAGGETQPLRMYKGEDGRVYVDNTSGTKTFRVAGDGSIEPIDMAHPGPGNNPALPPKKSSKPTKSAAPSKSAKPSSKPSSTEGGPGGSSSDSSGEPTTGSGEPSSPTGSRSSRSPVRLPSVTGLPTDRSSRGAATTPERPRVTKTKGTESRNQGRTEQPRNTGNGNGNGKTTPNEQKRPSKPRKQKPQNPQPPEKGAGDGSSAPVGNGNNPGNDSGGGKNSPEAPAAEKPDAPPSINVTAKIKVADVSWTRPSNNGAKITGYKITWPGGTENVKGTSTRITGLAAEKQYTVSVAARNSVGLGKAISRTFTTKKAPPPPVNFTANAVANADGSVTINWSNYPGALTYAIQRNQNGQTKQVSPDNGVTGNSFTTKDVTPGQPVSFTVLAYKLLVEFGTATTGQVTPTQPDNGGDNGGGNNGGGNNGGGNNGGGNNGGGQGNNGSTPVHGLDYTDEGDGNIEICWTKPDYPGDGELIGYHITYAGGSKDVDGAGTTGTTFQVNTRGASDIDVQGITRLNSNGKTVYGMHTPLQIQSNFLAERPEAPEVLLNKVSLSATHVLTVDMHLHDHGSPTRLSVVVDGKMVYGPAAARPGDQVLRIPNVVVQKGRTVDVQVGSYSDAGGSGNVATARVTAQ